MLALTAMDPTVRGIFFLVAVVLFVIAAVMLRITPPAALVAAGLAFGFFVFMWDAFAAS
jgi:hypothetical protein